MALVNQIERMTKERNQIHGRVDCTYTTFVGSDGKTYLQLDTYGSSSREFPGKISQSIQFGPDAARALREIINREFGA